MAKRIIVTAPVQCSFIKQPESTIRFFRKAEEAFLEGCNVTYDFSNSLLVGESAASVLISQMKDSNVYRGLSRKVLWPRDSKCLAEMKRLDIYNRIRHDPESTTNQLSYGNKYSNTIVSTAIAKQLVGFSSNEIYGHEVRLKELYSILIELMSNTKDHAHLKGGSIFPWWMFTFPNPRKRTVRIVFLDLGRGLFDSVIKKVLYAPALLPSRSDDTYMLNALVFQEIYDLLISRRLASVTKIGNRGRGLPHIANCSKSGHFESFYILSNNGYVDVMRGRVSFLEEGFNGTMYAFELKKLETM